MGSSVAPGSDPQEGGEIERDGQTQWMVELPSILVPPINSMNRTSVE